jgi:hypothetical protein
VVVNPMTKKIMIIKMGETYFPIPPKSLRKSNGITVKMVANI